MGEPDLALAAGLGPVGPNRKPVLQLLSPSGRPLGFAKVGWNEFTRRLVTTEAAALGELASRRLRLLRVPRVLHQGRWRDLEIVVVSPLPLDARPVNGPAVAAAGELARAAATSRTAMRESEWWGSVRLRAGEASDRFLDLLSRLEDRVGDREIESGRWHGDWAPWNLAASSGHPWALDWEHSGPAPVGLDLVHHAFQVAFLIRRRPLAVASRADAAPSLARLGIAADAGPVLAAGHLVEIALRAEEARRLDAGVNPRVYPAVLDAIEQRFAG